jgi:putative sigma-54 modulation protein
MTHKADFIEDIDGYRFNITGRHIHVTESMKNYAREKISKIERIQKHTYDIHVILDIQKLDHSVVMVLRFSHFKIKVSASSTDMYASIDKAVDRLQSSLRRWKGKIQDHHHRDPKIYEMMVDVIENPYADDEDFSVPSEELASSQSEAYPQAKMIKTEVKSAKHLRQEEAVMKMELSGDSFLIYTSEEDQKLKVIYKRKDGNYGIIIPQ